MKIDTDELIAEAREKGWPVADEPTVRELVEALRGAYEKVLNKPGRTREVSFVDGFMAAANFARLVIEDLEPRTGITSLAYKAEFRRLFVRTVERGLLQRLMQ